MSNFCIWVSPPLLLCPRYIQLRSQLPKGYLRIAKTTSTNQSDSNLNHTLPSITEWDTGVLPLKGKPLGTISAVQTGFYREGRGGWKPLLNGLGHLFSEYKSLLTETLNFHHISPLSTMISIRIPSKNNVWPLSLSKYPFPYSKPLF